MNVCTYAHTHYIHELAKDLSPAPSPFLCDLGPMYHTYAVDAIL